MSNRIALIGTRDLTLCHPEGKALFRTAAAHMARAGYTIVSLPSAGGCQLAAASALVVGGTVELVRPYVTYEADWVNAMCRENGKRVTLDCFDAELHEEWVQADHLIHPAHKTLGGTDTAFFACVFGVVQMSDAIIALPCNEEGGVEVKPAIRISEALGKPRLVLSKEGDRQQLEAMLG